MKAIEITIGVDLKNKQLAILDFMVFQMEKAKCKNVNTVYENMKELANFGNYNFIDADDKFRLERLILITEHFPNFDWKKSGDEMIETVNQRLQLNDCELLDQIDSQEQERMINCIKAIEENRQVIGQIYHMIQEFISDKGYIH